MTHTYLFESESFNLSPTTLSQSGLRSPPKASKLYVVVLFFGGHTIGLLSQELRHPNPPPVISLNMSLVEQHTCTIIKVHAYTCIYWTHVRRNLGRGIGGAKLSGKGGGGPNVYVRIHSHAPSSFPDSLQKSHASPNGY